MEVAKIVILWLAAGAATLGALTLYIFRIVGVSPLEFFRWLVDDNT